MKKIIKQEQWVMLPTNESPISIHFDTGALYYIGTMETGYVQNERNQPQHLYLTSDDEIKEGDWFYDGDGELCNYDSKYAIDPNKWESNVKIIATTDKSLKVEIPHLLERHTLEMDLPQIPESFIKYYVEKQGKVGDVELEYSDRYLGYKSSNTILTVGEHSQEIEGTAKDTRIFSLKLTENNEIVISIPKKVMTDIVTKKIEEMFIEELIKRGADTNSYLPKKEEKMYSRDDVTQMLVDYSNDLMNMKLRGNVADSVNQWIKENLPL